MSDHLFKARNQYLKKAREPISSYTHFWGAIAFGLGLGGLFLRAMATGRLTQTMIWALLIFGLSMIALYTASAVYHFSNANEKKVFRLRKLDHSMIYVLIAGSYTPMLLAYLPSPRCWYFMIFIWAFAIAGILVKLCWFYAPRWLSTLFYVVMGWSILMAPSIFKSMTPFAFLLLVLGGVSYTVGALIYGIQKPNPSPRFGSHEIFHLFILGGSFFHYLLVFLYIA